MPHNPPPDSEMQPGRESMPKGYRSNDRSNRGRPAAPPGGAGLADALDAPRRALQSDRYGRIAYYVAEPPASGSTRPLLLIHSINAAPSSYEVRPLFEHFRSRRPVFSIDLPGFGHSERSDRRYTPELYAGAINELLERVVGRTADAVALSLSAEFAARAALAAPQRFASLVLISPTGFSSRALPSPKIGRLAHGALTLPLWGQGLFDLVASRASIRYFLGQSFIGSPPQDLIDYAYATAHRPGARHAPLTFLSSQLFTRDALHALYAKLTALPVLAIADRDPYVTFERLAGFASARPNWQHRSLTPHMGLPHWERPDSTFQALEQFWG